MTDAMIDYAKWKEPKPFGISGCFRLRNESQFMKVAILSFLPYLDEAVLCVQPSEDDTVEIAHQLAEWYPKVKVVEYPYIVDWIDTPGFYDKDPDKPGHLVHMSNWALSQCSYSWICKVEGDVIALSTMQKIVDAVMDDPEGLHYYGMVILNLAGKDMDQFSKENPRNGGWDEAVFNNDPDQFKFVRLSKWETIKAHHKTCMGWTGIHMKRCKDGKTEGWNGETYLPLTKTSLAKALDDYAANRQPYPGTDDPHGIDELFDGQWRRWLKPYPTVSVIVPTYNRPEFLERALRSINAQTFQDYEIIVINDAGQNVWDVVKQFPKATLIEHWENKGLAASRNTGLRMAKGKYVTFLDDDDVLFPVHFQVLVHELNKGTKAAYTDAYRWENETYLRRTLSADYSLERLYAGCPFYVMCVMLWRDVFNGHEFDETLPSHEDYDMWLTLSDDIEFVHLPFITAAYSHRGDGSQISHQQYHRGYFDKVREKHHVESYTPYWDLKKPGKVGRFKVLKQFTGVIFGRTQRLSPGKVITIDIDAGLEYERGGFVKQVTL